ncbi:hypothetical protein KKF81_00085 [Candidatus Micrarchaeota archaeon]|nr:hypothetical protein [Candidatus Micrarchaeota archaeon]
MAKTKPIWSQQRKLKQSDIALSFLFAAPLPIETALNIAKIKMLMAAELNENKKDEYRELLKSKNLCKLARKVGRPTGRAREQLYELISKYLNEVTTKETTDKRKKAYRLSIDYYFDKFKPHYTDEIKTIIRKFFSEPETSYQLFHGFNYSLAFYPIVTVDELIETTIQTSLWFYEKMTYVLYVSVPTRGFVEFYPHNQGNVGYDHCSRPECPLNDKKYHLHNLRKEKSDRFKEAVKKIISDKFDDEVIKAAGEIISVSLYYQKAFQGDVTLLKEHPYKYYFVLGRLLTEKGLQNDSYQFNYTMALAENLKPHAETKMRCEKCGEKLKEIPFYKYYCENCEKYVTDEELCVDKEMFDLLDKFYLDAIKKKSVKFCREQMKKEFEKELIK